MTFISQPSRLLLSAQTFAFSLSFFSFSYDDSGSGGTVRKALLLAVPFLFFLVRLVIFPRRATLNRFVNIFTNNILLLSLPCYGLLTAFWSPDSIESLSRALAFLSAVLSLMALRAYSDEMPSGRALTAISGGFALSIIVALSFPTINPSAFGVPDPAWRGDRLGGWVIPPNTLGAFCAAMIGLCILRLQTERISLATFSILLVFTFVWYMTYSRGAIISTFISIVVCFCFVIINRRTFARSALLVYALSPAVLLYILYNHDRIDLLAILLRGEEDSSILYTATSRTGIWDTILQSTTPFSFLFGSGYAIASPNGPIYYDALITNHTHNGYLQIFSGLGFFFALFFIIYLWRTFRHNVILAYTSPAGVIALYFTIFFAINLLVESSVGFQVYPQFAMFALFSMRSARLCRRSLPSPAVQQLE